MTRLPVDGAKGKVRVVSDGQGGNLVVTLTDRTVTVRPHRCKSPVVTLTWGGIWQRGLMVQAEARLREKRARRRAR